MKTVINYIQEADGTLIPVEIDDDGTGTVFEDAIMSHKLFTPEEIERAKELAGWKGGTVVSVRAKFGGCPE